jgi:hypothetical protein
VSIPTRPTAPTRRTAPMNDEEGGSELPTTFSIDLNRREVPEGLHRIGDSPFYNTPPQIEPNECGKIHPYLAYVCDLDLKDPTSFALPTYEVSINGCGVCITMFQNYSATETSSVTYCYLLPVCRPEEEYEEHQEIPLTCSPNANVSWDDLENSNPTTGIPPKCPPPPPPTGTFGKPGQIVTLELWCDLHYHNKRKVSENQQPPIYEETDEVTPPKLRHKKTISAPYTPVLTSYFDDRSYSIDIDDTMLWKERINSYSTYVLDLGIWTWSTATNGSSRSHSELFAEVGFNTWRFVKQDSAKRWSENCTTIVKIGDEIVWPKPKEEPPPLPSPQKDMNCCADVRRLIKMVADLQKEVDKVKKRTGVDDFPVSVPQSLLSDRGNNRINLQNIPQQISWLAKQLDSLVGELPGEIEVEDIDPQTEGNQTRKLKFPTLADLLLEIAGLAINNKVNTETALTAILNAMVEIGSVKSTSTANYHAIQAVLDYLSPQLRQATVDLPLTFTPGETQIHKLFVPTTTKIKIVELDSKTDLQDDLADLKKFAAEWRAQNFRKIKLDGTEAQQIKSLIKNAASLLSDKELQSSQDDGSQNQVSDFSDFLNKAERGFTDVNGATDTINPYGRPYDQRPRIREIGDTSDRGTEGN